MTTDVAVTPYFPDKPVVDLNPNALIAFSCIKDEATRLPYFLEFYSSQGVEHFFFVLNNTTDTSARILESRDDVTVFDSSHSYKGTGAGRDMLYELCDHYAKGHWTLTLDVDEILLIPGAPYITLAEFVAHLDDEGVDGFYSVFLDFYSDKPLSQTEYLSGEDPFQVCPYYETTTYTLGLSVNPPYFKVTGGPRWRVFWNGDPNRLGPAMRKVTLVRWTSEFRYLYSTHSHTPIKLSSTTGVLAHFKFISEFESRTAADNAGSDRRQAGDYELYARGLENDPCFKTPFSRRFRSSADLCADGVMCVSDLYRKFASPLLAERGVPETLALPEPTASSLYAREETLSISAIAAVWPFFVARQTAAEALPSRLSVYNSAIRLREVANTIRIECVLDDKTLLELGERAQMVMTSEPLVVEVWSSGERVWSGELHELAKFTDSIVPNLFVLPVGHLTFRGDLELMLLPSSSSKSVVRPVSVATLERLQERSIGCVETVEADGIVTGWCLNFDSPSWRESICFWVGGTYVGRDVPTIRRRDLDAKSPHAFGFEYQLPPMVANRIGTDAVWCSVAASGYQLEVNDHHDCEPPESSLRSGL